MGLAVARIVLCNSIICAIQKRERLHQASLLDFCQLLDEKTGLVIKLLLRVLFVFDVSRNSEENLQSLALYLERVPVGRPLGNSFLNFWFIHRARFRP
jgi:hypothetical protein